MPRKKQVDERAETLGRNLARLRRSRGLTQVELAQKLGIDQAQLSHYERGVIRLHGGIIVDITKHLGVTADELLATETPTADAFKMQRRFLRKLKGVEELSQRDQRTLLRIIEGFIHGHAAKSRAADR